MKREHQRVCVALNQNCYRGYTVTAKVLAVGRMRPRPCDTGLRRTRAFDVESAAAVAALIS